MSTSHMNAGGEGRSFRTSSSATIAILRPATSKGIGSTVCVGWLNAGLYCRRETSLGLLMSSMSRITMPACQ